MPCLLICFGGYARGERGGATQRLEGRRGGDGVGKEMGLEAFEFFGAGFLGGFEDDVVEFGAVDFAPGFVEFAGGDFEDAEVAAFAGVVGGDGAAVGGEAVLDAGDFVGTTPAAAFGHVGFEEFVHLGEDEVDGAVADVPGEAGAILDDDGDAGSGEDTGFGVAFVNAGGAFFDDGSVTFDALRDGFSQAGLGLIRITY